MRKRADSPFLCVCLMLPSDTIWAEVWKDAVVCILANGWEVANDNDTRVNIIITIWTGYTTL